MNPVLLIAIFIMLSCILFAEFVNYSIKKIKLWKNKNNYKQLEAAIVELKK